VGFQTWHTLPFEKKVRGGCELPGADMQKPLRQNLDRKKQKSTGFGIFYKNHLCPSYEFYSEAISQEFPFFRKILIL
jgi:hypothetical protein